MIRISLPIPPGRLALLVTLAVLASTALAVLPGVRVASARADAPVAPVLVFGSSDNGYERDNMTQTLQSLGLDVDEETSLPPNIAGYRSVWDIDAYSGLGSDAESELVDYIRGGGSVYLTGERPCCEDLDASDQRILRAVLTNHDVEVGNGNDIDGPFFFNGSSIDGVARFPNLLTDFVPDSPGALEGLGNVAGPNALASSATTPVGGVWDEHDMTNGVGRAAILMDIDYLGADDRTAIVQNIENFLDHGLACTDTPGGAVTWAADSPVGCTTLLTPRTVSWAAKSTAGGIRFTEDTTNVTSNCIQVLGGGTTNTVTCDLSGASATGATFTITATDADGATAVRHYRVVPQNDPRNVPDGRSLDSDWWTWPDRDGDGIPDKWETDGVWVGEQFLDLPAMGSDPDHKDIFLRYDYLDGHRPSQQMLDDMTDAFNSMPLTNPDGASGVALHAEVGSSVPASVAPDFQVTAGDIQTVTTYTGFANSAGFGGRGVPQIVKWMFNRDPDGKIIGTAASIPGSFGWTGFDVDTAKAALKEGLPNADADAFAEASNATHEIGHLLGLHHHGASDKPNDDSRYHSIMSYAFSNFGVPTDNGKTRIDFSREHTVHYDYTPGDSPGELEFILGQHGDVPDFYDQSNDQQIDVPAEPEEVETLTETLQGANPASIQGYSQAFGLDATPDIPTLPASTAQVVADGVVTIPLQGSDPGGRPLAYSIVQQPAAGSAAIAGKNMTFTAPSTPGTETIIVRATNGTLSSSPANVTVTVASRSSSPACKSATAESATANRTLAQAQAATATAAAHVKKLARKAAKAKKAAKHHRGTATAKRTRHKAAHATRALKKAKTSLRAQQVLLTAAESAAQGATSRAASACR